VVLKARNVSSAVDQEMRQIRASFTAQNGPQFSVRIAELSARKTEAYEKFYKVSGTPKAALAVLRTQDAEAAALDTALNNNEINTDATVGRTTAGQRLKALEESREELLRGLYAKVTNTQITGESDQQEAREAIVALQGVQTILKGLDPKRSISLDENDDAKTVKVKAGAQGNQGEDCIYQQTPPDFGDKGAYGEHRRKEGGISRRKPKSCGISFQESRIVPR
jgi:hypothetical protein